MNNYITSRVSGVDTNAIDVLLPLEFEEKKVVLWHIDKVQTGYGHWKLLLDIDVEGERHILAAMTTDSIMIDYWDGKEHPGEGPSWLEDDYVGRLTAIDVVLNANQDQLIELLPTE